MRAEKYEISLNQKRQSQPTDKVTDHTTQKRNNRLKNNRLFPG